MNASSKIVTFNNPTFGDTRTVKIEGSVYFVGKDSTNALKYRNSNDAIKRHCKDWGVKRYPIPDALGRIRETVVIDQANLLRLITHSKLPEAQKFEAWIFEEVIPTVLSTGSYSVEQAKALNGKVDEPLGEYKQLISAQKELIEQQQRYILGLKSQQTVKTPLLPAKTEKRTYSTSEAIKYVQAWAPELTREWLFVKLRESNLMEWGSLEPTLEGVASGILVRKSYYGRKYSHVTVKGIDWLIEKATGMTTFKQRVAK